MITITTNPKGTYINSVPVDDTLAALIVRNGRLVKAISETKVIIEPDLNTPAQELYRQRVMKYLDSI